MAKILSMPASGGASFPFDLLAQTWSPNSPSANTAVAQNATVTFTMTGRTPKIKSNCALQGTMCRNQSQGNYADIEVSEDSATWTALTIPTGASNTFPVSISLNDYVDKELYIRVIAKNANPNTITYVPITAMSIV